MARAGVIGIFFINIQKIWIQRDNKLEELNRYDLFDYSMLSSSPVKAAGLGAPPPSQQQK